MTDIFDLKSTPPKASAETPVIRPSSLLATLSLVLSIAAAILIIVQLTRLDEEGSIGAFGVLVAIVALVLGYIARSKVKLQQAVGKKRALVGIILAYVSIAALFLGQLAVVAYFLLAIISVVLFIAAFFAQLAHLGG